MRALIDGDIVVFRAAASAEGEEEAWIPASRADKIIEDILVETDSDEYEIWITGKNNFRYSCYPEYKANRKDAKRPKWEQEVKEYLKAQWNANVSDGCEADDMLGVRQCELEESIICTIDKDLLQIPGRHYNFVKKEFKTVSAEEGIRFFYYQMLVGDPTDNIKGVVGIGKAKAEKLLSGLGSEEEYFQVVREAYGNDEEMLMNGQCLHIWKKYNDVWSPDFTDKGGTMDNETTVS